MGRYNDLFKKIYQRDSSSFPPPFNKLIKEGVEYRLKLTSEPREGSGYGRKYILVEVEHDDKLYTLYLSQVDMANRFSEAEKAEQKRTGNSNLSLVGRTIILKQRSPRRYTVLLEPERKQHNY